MTGATDSGRDGVHTGRLRPAPRQHGFARNEEFAIVDSSVVGGDPVLQMRLAPTEYSRAMWAHEFEYLYTVTLREGSLDTRVEVRNTGDEAFEFTGALHTYFAATDIGAVRVGGLEDLTYLDKVADPMDPDVKQSASGALAIGSAVDSVYLDAPAVLSLETGHPAPLRLEAASGWTDAVVWSPWTAMESCYKEFVCVEHATVRPSSLAPGETWTAEMSLAASGCVRS